MHGRIQEAPSRAPRVGAELGRSRADASAREPLACRAAPACPVSQGDEPKRALLAELGYLQDWLVKLDSQVIRLAGLLHCADHAGEREPWAVEIPASTLERAIAIAEAMVQHPVAAHEVMGGNPVVELAVQVAALLAKRSEPILKASDITYMLRGRNWGAEAVDAALDILVQHNCLRVVKDTRTGPGRRATFYEVHPQIHTVIS
jgi:replicative DNA helicase